MDLDPDQRQRLEACFHIPRVVVFAGHMIDQPGRPQPRSPNYLAPQVYQRIADTLARLDARIGVASAACGSDILFLEAMLQREGEINVILPHVKEEFIQTSVSVVPGTDWGPRFEAVIQRAAEVIIAGENRAFGNPMVYEYANLLLDGLAILRAKMLDTQLIPLVVWDGGAGDGPGGTSGMVQHWRSHGLEPVIIDINRLLAETPPLGPGTVAPASGPRIPCGPHAPGLHRGNPVHAVRRCGGLQPDYGGTGPELRGTFHGGHQPVGGRVPRQALAEKHLG